MYTSIGLFSIFLIRVLLPTLWHHKSIKRKTNKLLIETVLVILISGFAGWGLEFFFNFTFPPKTLAAYFFIGVISGTGEIFRIREWLAQGAPAASNVAKLYLKKNNQRGS